MKALRFLPLAFLADVHGFVLFAPYLLLVMALALTARQWARWRARASRAARPTVEPAAAAAGRSDGCEPCSLDILPAIP